MFWKRSKRASRRQRVLEELLWLDPVDRERRIIAGVAAGDFGAEEVDAALRLVARLDSLRGMSLPPGGRLVAGQDRVGYLPRDASREATVAGHERLPETRPLEPDHPVREPRHGRRQSRRAAESDAIPIVSEPIAVPVATDGSGEGPAVPEDALESMERWVAHGRFDGDGNRNRSRGRRVAESAEPADEAWPSIAWLRPG
jgi:hypothetical protein